MNRNKKLLLICSILVLSTAAFGCNTKKNPVQSTTSVTATPAPAIATSKATAPPAPVYPYAFPYTGIGSMTEVLNRPVMVMIEN